MSEGVVVIKEEEKRKKTLVRVLLGSELKKRNLIIFRFGFIISVFFYGWR